MQCMCVLGGQLAVWVINTPLHYTDGNWIVAQTPGMEKLVDLTTHSLGCFIAHRKNSTPNLVGSGL